MASNPNAPQDPKAEEKKMFKPRPDDWKKSGQGEPEPPSYPFWLYPSDSSVSKQTSKKKVVDTLGKKPSDPRKLYHFLHVENQRIQLQQKTWKLLEEILQQDKKKREAEADVDKAKNQLEAFQRDEEAEKEVKKYVEEQECKPGEEKKREEDKINCEKRWKETLEIVRECEKDRDSKVDKLEKEENKLKKMEEKFMDHMKSDVPNEKNIRNEAKREEREKFFCRFSLPSPERDGKEECMQSWKYAYAYGAVGDLPMHTCFLLGLVDLGMKVIDDLFMYEGFDLISLPYIDDTEAWKVEWPKSCPRMRFHSLFSLSFSLSLSLSFSCSLSLSLSFSFSFSVSFSFSCSLSLSFSFSFSFSCSLSLSLSLSFSFSLSSFSISFPHLSLSLVSLPFLPLPLPLFLPSSFSALNLVASSRL
jgi:hypothetical protein